MCGFIGAFGSSQPLLTEAALRQALDRLRRRGPDGEGIWRGEGAVLGHRRLAILDAESRAAQPMQSNCGRYVMAFNGEIYNFRDLRRGLEFEGFEFRTTSDTEVLLTMFAAHGESMLPKLYGMFAFVVWDRLERKAFIARDPYGIKPTYIWEANGAVMVASQVKALLATGRVSRDPSPRGQFGFWLLGSVPEPYTWFRDIRTLPPGHCAWIVDGKLGAMRSWNDIGDSWRNAGHQNISRSDVQDQVTSALRESIRRHLVADVPVAVFLSGGIDSGAVAGLMHESGVQDLHGVTIAYDEYAGSNEDEAPVAAEIASHFGIRHTVRRVGRAEFLLDLPDILDAMDQPSIDGVNTWYASKAVAELGFKVVVSGVGGDELFQGYSIFRTIPRLLAARRWIGLIPGAEALVDLIGRAQASRTGRQRWAHLSQWTQNVEGLWWLSRSLYAPEEIPALTAKDMYEDVIASFDVSDWVQEMVQEIPEESRLALGQIESMTYLRNQLLRDSDWASMAHSVELRTPLVDSHLLQQLQSVLPRFAEFPSKALLANAPIGSLPLRVTRRDKTGFGIPVVQWLGETGYGSWCRKLVAAYEANG